MRCLSNESREEWVRVYILRYVVRGGGYEFEGGFVRMCARRASWGPDIRVGVYNKAMDCMGLQNVWHFDVRVLLVSKSSV